MQATKPSEMPAETRLTGYSFGIVVDDPLSSKISVSGEAHVVWCCCAARDRDILLVWCTAHQGYLRSEALRWMWCLPVSGEAVGQEGCLWYARGKVYLIAAQRSFLVVAVFLHLISNI